MVTLRSGMRSNSSPFPPSPSPAKKEKDGEVAVFLPGDWREARLLWLVEGGERLGGTRTLRPTFFGIAPHRIARASYKHAQHIHGGRRYAQGEAVNLAPVARTFQDLKTPPRRNRPTQPFLVHVSPGRSPALTIARARRPRHSAAASATAVVCAWERPYLSRPSGTSHQKTAGGGNRQTFNDAGVAHTGLSGPRSFEACMGKCRCCTQKKQVKNARL